MITFEVYQVDGGFGARIFDNENPFIIQEYHPDLPGWQRMSETEANEFANDKTIYFNNLLYPIEVTNADSSEQ